MTLEEILDQAIAMLQRWGRLTYSTLKRQFQLNDAALDDLTNELIAGQCLAVDERGKREEAYTLLAPIYGWFTEGFDTAARQEAQAYWRRWREGGGWRRQWPATSLEL